MSHTPGPWVTTGNSEIFAGQELICRAAITANVGYDDMRANARLLAAAPELLSALEAYLPFLPPEYAKASMVAHPRQLVAAADIRAAIRKATGADK